MAREWDKISKLHDSGGSLNDIKVLPISKNCGYTVNITAWSSVLTY